MIVAVVFILLNAVLCFIAGSAILALAGGTGDQRGGDVFLLAILVGIVPWSALLLLLSFFVPLSPWGALVGVLLLVSFSVAVFRWLGMLPRIERTFLAGIALAAIVASITAVQPIEWYDTGAYHHMAVRILADYGTIPGQGLLEHRLAFSTQWFTLAASWDAGALRSRASGLTGSFALALLIFAAGMGLWRILHREATVSDWFAAFFIAPIQVPMGHLFATPSPDVAVLLLTFAAAWCLLLPWKREERKTLGVALIVLGAGCFGMKASGMVVAAVAGFFWIWCWRTSPRRILWGAMLGVALCLPMFAQSVLASGHLLFPSRTIAFDLPWTLTEELRANASRIIAAVPRQSVPEAMDLPTLQWLQQAWRHADPWGFVMTILSLVALPALAWESHRRCDFRSAHWLVPMAVGSIALYLFIAPHARFAAAALVLLPCLLLARAAERTPHAGALMLAAVVCTAFLPYRATVAFAFVVLCACGWHLWRSTPRQMTEQRRKPLPFGVARGVMLAAGVLVALTPIGAGGLSDAVVRPPRIVSPLEGHAVRLVAVNDWTAHVSGPETPLAIVDDQRRFLPWDAPFPATRAVEEPDTWLLRPERGPAGGWRIGPSEGARAHGAEVSD